MMPLLFYKQHFTFKEFLMYGKICEDGCVHYIITIARWRWGMQVYLFLSMFSRGRRLPGEGSLCSFSRVPDYLEEDARASYTNPVLKIK